LAVAGQADALARVGGEAAAVEDAAEVGARAGRRQHEVLSSAQGQERLGPVPGS
jgi:hypothetical protein